MKKNILIVFLLAIFSSTVFSMSKNSVTVEGYISTYGNMPFTYLGITTSDDELYIIEASEKIMDKIENLKEEGIYALFFCFFDSIMKKRYTFT